MHPVPRVCTKICNGFSHVHVFFASQAQRAELIRIALIMVYVEFLLRGMQAIVFCRPKTKPPMETQFTYIYICLFTIALVVLLVPYMRGFHMGIHVFGDFTWGSMYLAPISIRFMHEQAGLGLDWKVLHERSDTRHKYA